MTPTCTSSKMCIRDSSWGALANAALPSLYTSPYQLFYPALIMSITILALNLFSDGLRDSLDPRLRK